MKISIITIFIGCLLLVDYVQADGWFYQSTFSSTVEADDNRRLRRDDEKGVVGINARTDIKISNVTEISEVYVRGALSSVRYDGGDDRAIDSDDQLLFAGGQWNGERSQFSVDAEYLGRSTQLTELEDTGFLEVVDRRVDKSISPQYVYILNESLQLFVGGNYTEVDFPNSIPVNLTEYSVKGANAGAVYALDELNSITVSAFNSKYDADTFSNKVETTGANIRYDKTFTELWNGYAELGYRKSNFKNRQSGQVVRDDDTGESYQVGVTRNSEISELSLSASNELQPSADGDVNERTEINMDYKRSFTSRLTGSVNFNWFEDESINNDTEEDREYWSLSFNGDFRLTEQWYLTGQLRHREQKFDDDSNAGRSSAESDAVIIGVRFNGKNNRI